jgi:hypothetical protein
MSASHQAVSFQTQNDYDFMSIENKVHSASLKANISKLAHPKYDVLQSGN